MDGKRAVPTKRPSILTLPMFENQFYCCLEREDQDGVVKFLKVLQGKTTNTDRLMYIHENLSHFKLFRGKYQYDEKSDDKANKYKKTSDQCFVVGEYSKAMKGYTKALMLSERKELSAIAYANRSAALFKLGLYQECLTDIDRAIANNYPEKLKPKLIDRRTKASEMLETSKGTTKYYEEVPTIPPAEKNATIPFATNRVEIKSCERGTRVVATTTINIGDIIAVEQPLVSVIAQNNLVGYSCHECFELCYNLIPCDVCTQVLYCSEACRSKAFLNYHKHECPILFSLNNCIDNSQLLVIALKYFLQSEGKLSDEMSRLIRLSNNNDPQEIRLEMIAAVMYDLVKNHTEIFDGPNGKTTENFFTENIVALLKVVSLRASGIIELCPFPDEEGMFIDHAVVAYGIFTFCGMLRHACNPNAIPIHHGVNRVLRAIRTIEKGQKVLVSFGSHYCDADKKKRQDFLFAEYKFKCTCRACKENWTSLNLSSVPVLYQAYRNFVIRIQKNPDVKLAKAVISTEIQSMKLFEAVGEPNAGLIFEQIILVHCYRLLGNKRMIS